LEKNRYSLQVNRYGNDSIHYEINDNRYGSRNNRYGFQHNRYFFQLMEKDILTTRHHERLISHSPRKTNNLPYSSK